MSWNLAAVQVVNNLHVDVELELAVRSRRLDATIARVEKTGVNVVIRPLHAHVNKQAWRWVRYTEAQ